MPLGIDRSDFFLEKNKRLEKDLRAKDGRIVALETENAMLYLKLAQMRSSLQSSREEVSGLQSQYEGETKFRQNVIDSALRFKQELEAKDGRIVALETENAMLYLKLAQMRSSLQSSREEVSGLQSQYEGETKFRQNVIDSALRFKQELEAKDGRIVALETENAMLYLKLAQMRSSLQSSREEVSGLQSQYEGETKFRQNVIDSALRFKQELEIIKRKLSALQRVAVDLPIQFQNDIKHANSVVQRHRHLFVSQTSSLSSLQDKLSQLQEALQDVTDRHAKEKKRRQELHNVLMELRGNIRVHCRVRPLMEFDSGGEDSKMLGSSGTKSEVVVHYMDDENVCVRTTKHNKVFEYERLKKLRKEKKKIEQTAKQGPSTLDKDEEPQDAVEQTAKQGPSTLDKDEEPQDAERKPVIASIDFGTTFSGYAFMYVSDIGKFFTDTMNEREPTCVLLNEEKEFHSFGLAAIENYNEMEVEEQQKYFFFKHFKMALYEVKKLSRRTKLTDQSGKQIDAMVVFEQVIGYFKEKIMKHIKEVKIRDDMEFFTEKDIEWMITIPAIWTDSVRQFMREAAKRAGLIEENVRLVLEPEAASIICRDQPLKLTGDKTTETLGTGHKYILADIGGGTVDICSHEILEDGKLRELYRATGGYAGGSRVNHGFERFLVSIFGGPVMHQYKTSFPNLYHDLMVKFETKKRSFKVDTEKISIDIDFDLVNLFENTSDETVEEAFLCSDYKENVRYRKDRRYVTFNNSAMRVFFDSSVNVIIEKLKEILAACSTDNITTLLLAGGYAESPYLKQRIQDELQTLKVVTVDEPRLAVMKGAVMTGLKPRSIIQRRARYTYGFSVGKPFKEGEHPEHLKYYHDGKAMCRDLFEKMIEKGQVLQYQDTFCRESYDTCRQPENKQFVINTLLWRSSLENPSYCTEGDQCELVGRIVMNPPSGGWPDKLKGGQHLIVGETEFTMKVYNKTTGEEYETQMDFL